MHLFGSFIIKIVLTNIMFFGAGDAAESRKKSINVHLHEAYNVSVAYFSASVKMCNASA